MSILNKIVPVTLTKECGDNVMLDHNVLHVCNVHIRVFSSIMPCKFQQMLNEDREDYR